MAKNDTCVLRDKLVKAELDRISSLVADDCKDLALSRNDKHATIEEYLNSVWIHCDEKYPIRKDLLNSILYIPPEGRCYHIMGEVSHALSKHIGSILDNVNIFWKIINEEVDKIKELDKFKRQENAINATLDLIERYHGEEKKIKLLDKLIRLAPELHIGHCELFINECLY